MSNADRAAMGASTCTGTGPWWILASVALIFVGRVLPAGWPSLFVPSTGEIASTPVVGTIGLLVAVELWYGVRIAQWIAVAYLIASLAGIWNTLSIPGYHVVGGIVLAVLHLGALVILLAVPAVHTHFSKKASGGEAAA